MEYFTFIVFFSFLVFMSVLAKDDKATRTVYYFFAIIVALLTGLRGMADEYTRLFVRVLPLSEFFTSVDVVGVEKGYLFAFICSVLKTIGFGSQSLFLVFALTSVSIHAFYYRKFTRYYFLAFLIYLSHQIQFHEWVQIRAGLSSALILPAIYCLTHQKKTKFYLLVLSSTLVQYVGILSYLLIWLREEIKIKYLVVGLILATGMALSNTTGWLLKYLSDSGVLPQVIYVYTIWGTYNYDIGLLHAKTFQQIIILLAAIYLRKRMPSHPSPYFTLVFNTYYMSTLLAILFSDMRIFATRFASHFYVVEPILLIFLSRYFVEKKTYSFALACFAILISFENYVLRALLPPYSMFVDAH